MIDVDTDADDDARGWQDEFNRRAKVQFVNTEGPSPWGAIHCVDGVLVVAEMQTRALPELEDFLSSIWP